MPDQEPPLPDVDPISLVESLRAENERLRIALDQVTQDMTRILVMFFERNPEFAPEKQN